MRNMKRLSLALALIFGVSSLANASDQRHTITGGYAQSTVWVNGDTFQDDPNGFNLKYRGEFNDELGIIVSYTNISYDESVSYGSGSASLSLDYQSIMIGPSFRANDYFSAYLMIGAARGDAKLSATQLGSAADSATDIAFGGGLQLNATKNITIDASYEYSNIDDIEVGTWVVGAGISF